MRRQPRSTFGCRQRVGRKAFEALVPDLLRNHVEPADDHRQQIVEVVRDAAGQLAERLHLLALPKLVLRRLEFGNVARFEQEVDDLALFAAHRPERDIEIGGRHPLARHHYLGLEAFPARRRGDGLAHQFLVLGKCLERGRVP